jgi:hypothetical protein
MYGFEHNRAAEEGQFCFVKIVFGGGNMGGFCDQAKVPWLCRNVTD